MLTYIILTDVTSVYTETMQHFELLNLQDDKALIIKNCKFPIYTIAHMRKCNLT